jgi:hypothetical protein
LIGGGETKDAPPVGGQRRTSGKSGNFTEADVLPYGSPKNVTDGGDKIPT